MKNKQLQTLEHRYLMALCVVDHYRQQGMVLLTLSCSQFAAVEGLDWNEYEVLKEHLEKKGIDCCER